MIRDISIQPKNVLANLKSKNVESKGNEIEMNFEHPKYGECSIHIGFVDKDEKFIDAVADILEIVKTIITPYIL